MAKEPDVATEQTHEMADEISVRLGARKRFYRAAFAVFSACVFLPSLVISVGDPAVSPYVLAGAASSVLGTGVVLLWAYTVRESALYEDAGRSLLGNR